MIAVIDATRNMQLAYASASASMDQFKNTVAAWSVVEENMQMLKGVTTEMMNGNTCSLAPAEKITALTSRLVALNTAQVCTAVHHTVPSHTVPHRTYDSASHAISTNNLLA